MSIIPPEPCPIHDPERAYWRMRLLREFGGEQGTTTTTTVPIVIKTSKDQKKIAHYMHRPHNEVFEREALCGDESGVWTRVEDWVTCEECKKQLGMMK